MIQPTLSICIPTRNRGELLRENLATIIDQEVFLNTSEIEIIISDNSSTDETQEIALAFTKAHPDKIVYFRNEVNFEDKNVEIVLSRANGKFLKLQNDNFTFNPGGLQFLVEAIKVAELENKNLFFINSSINDQNEIVDCENLDSFIKLVNFNSTWIGGFGIWKSTFDQMQNFSRAVHTKLPQTDALFRLFTNGICMRIICAPLQKQIKEVRKGGYSLSKIFGESYFSLLKPYLEKGLITSETYLNEKKNIFLNHILPYYFSENNDFNKFSLLDGLFEIESEDYFYPAIEAHFLNYIKVVNLENTNPDIYSLWRFLNPHNNTFLNSNNYKKIHVGRKTYGPINARSWGNSDEFLKIGSFVSIAENVEFLLGGEHPYSGLSTYPFKVMYFGFNEEAISKGPIIVSDDVWIGHGATILSGVFIGQGAVIGAKSVVTKDVEPYSICAGNPAKHIKYRFSKEIIEILSKIDYAKITDALIISLEKYLYEPLTIQSAEELLKIVNSDGFVDQN